MVDVDGFDQAKVKTGSQCIFTVFFLAITGHGYQAHGSGGVAAAQVLRNLIA